MDHIPTEIREVYVSDRMAVAKNVAANGRLFCTMLAVIGIAAYMVTREPWYLRAALLATLPIGSSCIVDQLPAGSVRVLASLATYSLAAAVALVLLFTIG